MKKICVITCSVLLAICFVALIAMDIPTLTRQETINVDYNGNNIVMTLYKGEDKGVLMLGGDFRQISNRCFLWLRYSTTTDTVC